MKFLLQVIATATLMAFWFAPTNVNAKPQLLEKETGEEVQWVFAPRTKIACGYRTLQAYQKDDRVVFLNCVDGKCRWINGNRFTFILWPGKTALRNVEIVPKDARLHFMCRGRRGQPTCGCSQWLPDNEDF